jgi:hypothetical protein
MKTIAAAILGCVLIAGAYAADSASRITPAIQAALDGQTRIVSAWAANPKIVSAVKTQNKKGPLAGMTNHAWKSVPADGPLVRGFEKNAAGQFLSGRLAASGGLYREAFLSAAQGEKAAFVDKPSDYLHAGTPKFAGPMGGNPWQGKPEFDKSSYSYVVQVAVPVRSGGKPIGVLVVGISMKALTAMAKP